MTTFRIIATRELEQELQRIEGLTILKKENKTDNPSYNSVEPSLVELTMSFVVSVSGSIAANLLWAAIMKIINRTHKPITFQTTSSQIEIDEESSKEDLFSTIKVKEE